MTRESQESLRQGFVPKDRQINSSADRDTETPRVECSRRTAGKTNKNFVTELSVVLGCHCWGDPTVTELLHAFFKDG